MRFQVALSFLLYSFLLGLLDQGQPANGNFVIFENVGVMASSLSYLHGQITLNLSSIEDHLDSYIRMLDRLNTSIIPTMERDDVKPYYAGGVEKQLAYLHRRNTANTYEIIKLHIKEAEEIRQQLVTLRHILPFPSDADEAVKHFRRGRDTTSKNETFSPTDYPLLKETIKATGGTRNARFLTPLALPFGIFGTFMGLYNKQQIDHLRRELQTTQAGMNKLVEVTKLHTQHIAALERALYQLTGILHMSIVQNPGLLEARLNRVENQIQRRIQIATHVLQAAQLQRLSIDFLTQNQVQTLFAQLLNRAEKYGCKLLLEHHSDLFQVEVSYFFDGRDVHLLLHVPMVTPDSMLRLLKLHSFPLPIASGTHYLIPSSENDILAITAGSERYSTQISSSDLLGCHMINKVYLCESHGVLRRTYGDTCLGALYHQNVTAVKKLCTLQIHHSEEVIRQLLNNWFAVFSPVQLTIPVECKNGTSKELMIAKGINKFHLSQGCTAQFANHIVTSDYSIREPADFIEYEWKWTQLSDLLPDDLGSTPMQSHMELFSKYGLATPTLEDLQLLRLQEDYTPGWWAHFVHFVGNATLVITLIVVISIVGYRFYKHRQFKQNQQQVRQQLEDQANEQDALNPAQVPTEDLIIRPPRYHRNPSPAIMPMH